MSDKSEDGEMSFEAGLRTGNCRSFGGRRPRGVDELLVQASEAVVEDDEPRWRLD